VPGDGAIAVSDHDCSRDNETGDRIAGRLLDLKDRSAWLMQG
jgi:hypothetical protein